LKLQYVCTWANVIICENSEKRNFLAWKVQFFENLMKKGHEMCDLFKTRTILHRQHSTSLIR
jgi:hypothetical protein